jgi:phosphohistidine phosphatase SixA
MRILPLLAIAAACALAAPAVPAQPSPERGAAPAQESSPAEVLREMRRGGYVLYLRHAATDPTQNDAGMTSFTDCRHQRNLVDKGRYDAQMIGGSIRALAIPIQKVLASPYCRTVETAELAFGRIEKLNEMRYSGPAQPGEDRYAELRKLLATPPKPGTNIVIVGHGSPMQAIAGLSLGEGEMVIIRPLGDRFEVFARIRASDWEAMTK